MNILVFDVGTSSMRGILFTDKGEELTESQYLYSVTYMQNSWVEQKPSDWENALYSITKEVVADAKKNKWSIDAITLDSLRSATIPMDKHMNPLTNAIMWQDKRNNGICEALNSKNDRIFALSGSRVNPVFSGSKMTWIRENEPDIYSHTAKFVVIPDYVNYLMTGELSTDWTYGSRSNLMNIYTHEWDDELLEIFRVDKTKLLDLVPPGSIVGNTTAEFEEITGMPKGVPVITAGGDQQCGAIGQGVVKKGNLSLTAGTGGYLITDTDKVPENLEQDVICNYSSVKGRYILECSVLTCCSAFNWFRNEFFEGVDFDELNQMIEETPIGSNGCLCIPYFQGRSTPDWNNLAKGVFSNVTLATTRKDMMRSLLESICYEFANGIDTMNKYVKIRDIYVNGGLTNSDPFNEIQTNVYNSKITKLGKSDATARGALIIAATSLGIYKNVSDAYDVIGKNKDVKVYRPQKDAALQYETYRAQMNRLYRKIWGADLQDNGDYEFQL